METIYNKLHKFVKIVFRQFYKICIDKITNIIGSSLLFRFFVSILAKFNILLLQKWR